MPSILCARQAHILRGWIQYQQVHVQIETHIDITHDVILFTQIGYFNCSLDGVLTVGWHWLPLQLDVPVIEKDDLALTIAEQEGGALQEKLLVGTPTGRACNTLTHACTHTHTHTCCDQVPGALQMLVSTMSHHRLRQGNLETHNYPLH